MPPFLEALQINLKNGTNVLVNIFLSGKFRSR